MNQPYDYLSVPVKGPSTVFAILFAFSGIAHIYQISRYRSWRLLWLLPCACILLTAGSICREYNAFRPSDEGTLSVTQGLLHSGAIVLAASLYMILFYLMSLQSKLSPIPSYANRFLCCVFFTAIISLTSQGVASFFSTNASPASAKSGHALLQASLVLQLFLSVTLLGILGLFQRRCSKANVFDENSQKKINIVIMTLYTTIILMNVRNIFSTAQIFSPKGSPAWKTEVLFCIFGAVPLVLCSLILNITHPAKFLL